MANTTVHTSATSGSTISASAGQITTAPNATVDECFSSWDSWWSASWLESYGTYKPETTYTTSWTLTISAYNGTTETWTSTIDTTQTIFNGLFPIETDTIDTTSYTTVTGEAQPATVSSSVATVTSSSLIRKNNALPEPTCTLPKIVPACQSQWERWVTTQLMPAPTPPPHCDINAGFLNNRNTVPPCAKSYSSAAESYSSFASAYPSPFCSQAAVTGSLCESIRENYVHQGNYNFDAEVATTQYLPFFSAGYLGGFSNISATDFNTTWFWPTSSTLGAPSCTLGCGRCAVTGGTVQLIYWPQTPTATGGNSTAPQTSPAGPVTVETLGTTFTSPTLYISYASVYAANGCSVIGTDISSTIVAIPTNSPLSSVYGGAIPCDAHMRYTQEWTATAPFTVEDMNEPVPCSIYSSQPWCATYLRNQGCVGSCPTSAPYKPILVVPEEVLQDMEPAWRTCYGDVRGVYDPPVALRPVSSEAGVSMPGATITEAGQSQTATPASGPGPTTPTQTAAPTSTTVPIAESEVASDSVPGPSGYGPTSAQDPDPTSIATSDQTSSADSGNTAGSDSKPGTGQSIAQGSGQDTGATTTQNAGGVLGSILAGGGTVTGDATVDPSVAASADASSSQGSAPEGQDSSAANPTLGAVGLTPQSSKQETTAMADPQGYSIVSQASGSGGIVIASGDSTATLASSGAAPTLGGQRISVGSSGEVFVGSSSIGLATAEPKAYNIVSQASGSGGVVVANDGSSATLTPGGAATTLGGQQVSIGSSGQVLVGSSTVSNAVADGATASPSSGNSGQKLDPTSTESDANAASGPSATSSTSNLSTSSGMRTSAPLGLPVIALLLGVLLL